MLSPNFESPANVLVVDDEQAMQAYARALLEPEGYQVETVSSGADALHLMRQGESPDVVLLDMLMPGLDGLQTLAQMHPGGSCPKGRHAVVRERQPQGS